MKAREFTQSALRRWPLGALALVVALAFGLAGQVATTPLTADTNVPATVKTKVHYPDHTPLPCFNTECLSEQVGSVGPLGTVVVHDKAIVYSSESTLSPTGIVQFKFYKGNMHCMGTPFSSAKVTITAVGDTGEAESSDTAPLPPGDYSYKAVYQPNEAARDKGFNNTPANCEQLRLISINVSTKIHFGYPTDPPAHTSLPCVAEDLLCRGQEAPAFSTVHDQATINASKSPTGSVRFAFFVGESECRDSPDTIETVPVTINPLNSLQGTAESSAEETLAPGVYSYKAIYDPNTAAKNQGLSSAPSPCEQLRINSPVKTNTVIHFQSDDPNPANHTALDCYDPDNNGCTGLPEQQGPANSKVHDQATVDTTQTNRTPTGTVQFRFFVGTPHCEGSAASSEDVEVSSGNGSVVVYESSATLALTPGDYSYRAIYTPDATAIGKGIGSSTSPCEQLKILAGP